MADIQIRKRRFRGNGYREAIRRGAYTSATIWVVVVDGKRVDSFMKFSNAQKKARALRVQYST